MTLAHTLATSADSQWVVARTGREVAVFAGGAGPAVGALQLEHDDVDLALAGPPDVLVAIVRDGFAARVVLYELPQLEAVARLDLEWPMHVAAITGPRLVLASPDGKQVTIVREAGRGLSQHAIDVGSPVEFCVGLDKNQVLFGLLRKQEVWDAATGRPLLRPQLPLPPPPRAIGAAAGHLWAIQPGRDEVFVYRLSDGRPFRHYVGSPVEDVICHPASPVVVLVTPRGLVRMHCYAHSLTLVEDAPWLPGIPLALIGGGEDVALLGFPPGHAQPWQIVLGGTGAPIAQPTPASEGEPTGPPLLTAADKLRAMRGGHEPAEAAPAPIASPPVFAPPPRPAGPSPGWRESLAVFGQELARGVTGEPPAITGETELGQLAEQLALGTAARRALGVLYGLYLVGEPALSIARLARAIGGWPEALGTGELGALAMLRRKHGKVALRTAVTDLLDGAPPRAIRLVGDGPATLRAGAFRVSRDGRSDDAIEAELVKQLGRIAIVHGRLPVALLEARLRSATAVTLSAPDARPSPWPRDASLVLVLYGSASSWVADLPSLTAS